MEQINSAGGFADTAFVVSFGLGSIDYPKAACVDYWVKIGLYLLH